MAAIDQELFENCATENLLPEEEIMLLHERILCSDMLTERHLRSMQRFQNQDKVKVFISHSSIDLAFSRAIATDLRMQVLCVFGDWSINIGERIFEKTAQDYPKVKRLS